MLGDLLNVQPYVEFRRRASSSPASNGGGGVVAVRRVVLLAAKGSRTFLAQKGSDDTTSQCGRGELTLRSSPHPTATCPAANSARLY